MFYDQQVGSHAKEALFPNELVSPDALRSLVHSSSMRSAPFAARMHSPVSHVMLCRSFSFSCLMNLAPTPSMFI